MELATKMIVSIIFFLTAPSAFPQDSIYYITPAQDKIEAGVNVPFIIQLRSCHDCGNHWHPEQIDTVNVKLISYRQAYTSGRVAQKGGEVYEYWKFEGLKLGHYILEFVERGPAKDHKEIGRVRFQVLIE